MLTLPIAPRRSALLEALQSLVADAGSAPVLSAPVPPERLTAALATRGPRHLASVAFRAAGMADPQVEIMGGSGAATAFRAQGKAFVRMGAELPPNAAIASVIRAATAMWRQASDLPPAACEEDEVATSVYLSLGAAEAVAAHGLAERERAADLVFLLAAQSLSRNQPRQTAAVAWDLGEPLDALYEDGLRLLALRGEELRTRLRVDASGLPFGRAPLDLIGSPPDAAGELDRPIAVASLDDAYRLLATQPCPCGGRWRIAEPHPTSREGSVVRSTLVCRVCFRWRAVLWQLDEVR